MKIFVYLGCLVTVQIGLSILKSSVKTGSYASCTPSVTPHIPISYIKFHSIHFCIIVPPEVSPSDGAGTKPISLGNPVTISFAIVNVPVPPVMEEDIQWVFMGGSGDANLTCTNTTEYTFANNCLNLTVQRAEVSDVGLYRIAITTEAGSVVSAIAVAVSGGEPWVY